MIFSVPADQNITENKIVLTQEQEKLFKEICQTLRCPTCQNISIWDSESEVARMMRDIVRKMVAEGKGKDEIIAWFIQRYGQDVLMEPENKLFYILPFLAFTAGTFALLVVVVKRNRNKST